MLGQKPTKEDIRTMLAEVDAETDNKICIYILRKSIALKTFLQIMTEQKKNYALEDDYDISINLLYLIY